MLITHLLKRNFWEWYIFVISKGSFSDVVYTYIFYCLLLKPCFIYSHPVPGKVNKYPACPLYKRPLLSHHLWLLDVVLERGLDPWYLLICLYAHPQSALVGLDSETCKANWFERKSTKTYSWIHWFSQHMFTKCHLLAQWSHQCILECRGRRQKFSASGNIVCWEKESCHIEILS